MYDNIEIFRDTEDDDFKKIDIIWSGEKFSVIIDDDYSLCNINGKLVFSIDDINKLFIGAEKHKPNVLLRMAEAIAYTIDGKFPKIL